MKIKIEIKTFGGSVLFAYEATDNTIKKTLERAVGEHADLTGADLRGAYLRGAYLTGADLRGADLRGAYLRGADLRGADLRGADLRGAYLTGAELRTADWDKLPQEWIELCSRDILFIFEHLKAELPEFRKRLIAGEISGTQYTGDCACLVGTMAKIKNPNADDEDVDKVCTYIPFYTKNSRNPGETFFLAIHKGDTPKNSAFAKHALLLIDMVLGKKGRGRPRKV